MAGEDLIFGIHAVEAMLEQRPDQIAQVYVMQGREDQRLQKLLARVQQHDIPLQRLSRNELDSMADGGRHQGICARVRELKQFGEDDLPRLLESLNEPPFLLILDGVQDPHNLGACLRSADGAGVHAVIAPKDRAVSLNATVRKVASGAAESVPFIQVTNLARCLRELQQAGIWLVGTSGEATQSLYETDLSGPLGLVMGAEGQGMRRLTKEHCDSLVRLPMRGQVESLNVSVATGVCLYEALRQRSGGKR